MLNLLLPYYDTILSKLTVITESSIPTLFTKSKIYNLYSVVPVPVALMLLTLNSTLPLVSATSLGTGWLLACVNVFPVNVYINDIDLFLPSCSNPYYWLLTSPDPPQFIAAPVTAVPITLITEPVYWLNVWVGKVDTILESFVPDVSKLSL